MIEQHPSLLSDFRLYATHALASKRIHAHSRLCECHHTHTHTCNIFHSNALHYAPRNVRRRSSTQTQTLTTPVAFSVQISPQQRLASARSGSVPLSSISTLAATTRRSHISATPRANLRLPRPFRFAHHLSAASLPLPAHRSIGVSCPILFESCQRRSLDGSVCVCDRVDGFR